MSGNAVIDIKKKTVGAGFAGYAVVLLALVSVFCISFLKIYDYDVWFHMRTGEYILRNHTIPTADVFSYTAYGHPWITHEWLSGVILYLVYSIGGLSALTVFKSMMITATFAVLTVFSVKRGVSAYVAVPVSLLAAVLAKERFLERPELFTFLFMAVYMCVLDSIGAERDDRPGARVWALPAIMVFWANAHAGALFGLVIIGAYAFGEAATYMFNQGLFDGMKSALESRRFRSIALVFLVTVAAGLVNPNTYHVYTLPFYALKIDKETGLGVEEFAPPNMAADSLFFFAFAAALVVIVLNIKKAKTEHLTLFALFSYSAFRYNRNISVWAIVMVPLLGVCANEMAGRLLKGRIPLDKRALAVLYAAAIVIFTAGYISRPVKLGWWGAGANYARFPEKALQFLDREGIGGNMYNSYEFGGYIVWRGYPKRPVYVDGRNDIYIDLLKDQRVLAQLGFENIVNKYGINYAIFSYRRNNADYINPDPYFGSSLILVYWDDAAMVYLKNTPQNAPVIEKYGYRHVRPADLDLDYTDLGDPHSLVAELKRNIAQDPAGARNRLLLARVYEKLGYKDGPR